MSKVIVYEWMSLDGVAQGPTAPDEDTSGDFEHGGWHVRYFDDMARGDAVRAITGASGFLFGRRTFEQFARYWPDASPEEQVIAEPLNTKPKHVASATLQDPLPWQNSELLKGGVAQAVQALKDQEDGYLLVIGSAGLVHTLLSHDLVDEIRLMIDPVILGSGKRLFGDAAAPRLLELVSTKQTTTGAILATYARTEK
ncbi:dihydrofolate reductase family protein [Actinomadura macrotermitis]|uniref:Bacterial bifunctional deaminase-reductase C-terminal domain-containing protein n=1 Tax=Actinomadura macrotermitis TaxID=2585200 RepID=A0A7K0BXJ4_9ACTN|nr:dihydrofolate reductase family protein [Actinomadura macrotermitis]MQY05806.1 hypothetical protein [Actinomadura macrotermitis]